MYSRPVAGRCGGTSAAERKVVQSSELPALPARQASMSATQESGDGPVYADEREAVIRRSPDWQWPPCLSHPLVHVRSGGLRPPERSAARATQTDLLGWPAPRQSTVESPLRP